MSAMPLTHILLFAVLAVVGGLAVYTDVRERRIYNFHLALGLLAGALAILYAAALCGENMNAHIINGLTALGIGAGLFYYKQWKGGDAKLFMLLALLMPATGYEGKYFLTSVVLFGSTFIAGSMIIVPFLVYDVICRRQEIFKKEDLRGQMSELYWGILMSFLSSWLLFPVWNFVRLPGNSTVALVLTFVLWCFLRQQDIPEVLLHWQALAICIIGLVARLVLAPHMLSVEALGSYAVRIVVWGILFILMNIMIRNLKSCKDRVPFAVFLVMGCVLSYTPFLKIIFRR